MRDVSTLLDLDLLGIVYVEHVLHELCRIVRIFDDLIVLAGKLLEIDLMLALLSDGGVRLYFLLDVNEFVLGLHAIDDIRLRHGLK